MRRVNRWHPSHEATPRQPLPARTREAIAARNQQWPTIAHALGLPVVYLNAKGLPARG